MDSLDCFVAYAPRNDESSPSGDNDGLRSDKRIVKVSPIRVCALNQRQLLYATTRFDLLLTRNRIDHALVQLIPNQNSAFISGRESLHQPLTVFDGALWQI